MPTIKHILSIDDQSSICQMISFTMSDLSNNQIEYIVDIANDGQTGIDKAKAKQYDLVITDQKMPGDVDGLMVIKTLKSLPNYRSIPVVMLTMETTEHMKNAARDAGASGWMNKPFTPASLINMVQRLLK